MMTTNMPGDADIARIAHGLIDRSLPKTDWTHAAHFAAALWLVRAGREAEMPARIRAYNTATGVANTDSSGYHETITQLYVIGIGLFAQTCAEEGLLARVNALLDSPISARDWPLRFYSAERLFSVEARRGWVEPDVSPILL